MKVYRYGTNLKSVHPIFRGDSLDLLLTRALTLFHHFDLAPGPLAGLRTEGCKPTLIITYHGDWVDTYGGTIRRLGVAIHNRFLVDKS
jgi:hypothetical protein